MQVILNQPTQQKSWYLVRCLPRKETFTSNILKTLLGIDAYIPECRYIKNGVVHFVPFFPGYIFVLMDPARISVRQINSSPGVLHLVTFGDEPCSIPTPIIDEITERLSHLEILNLQQFQAGDPVRVKQDGPLQNLEMVFLKSLSPDKRAAVLLSFLGRWKEIQVDVETLEIMPHAVKRNIQDTSLQRERIRYTRGKGRKIHYSA